MLSFSDAKVFTSSVAAVKSVTVKHKMYRLLLLRLLFLCFLFFCTIAPQLKCAYTQNKIFMYKLINMIILSHFLVVFNIQNSNSVLQFCKTVSFSLYTNILLLHQLSNNSIYTHNTATAFGLLCSILAQYRPDISQYSKNSGKMKIKSIFGSISPHRLHLLFVLSIPLRTRNR